MAIAAAVTSADATEDPPVEGFPGAGVDVHGEAVAGAVGEADEHALVGGGELRQRRREDPPLLLGGVAPLPAHGSEADAVGQERNAAQDDAPDFGREFRPAARRRGGARPFARPRHGVVLHCTCTRRSIDSRLVWSAI